MRHKKNVDANKQVHTKRVGCKIDSNNKHPAKDPRSKIPNR